MLEELYHKKHKWVLGGFELLRADTTAASDPGAGGVAWWVDDLGATGTAPYAALAYGGSGSKTAVSTTNPLPVGGSGAAALGKAEDAVHASGDVGVGMLFVRRDTPSAGAADGDYAFGSLDANGLIRVNASGANVPVTDAGGSLTIDTSQLPATLGQTTGAGSLSIVPASDAVFPINDNGGSITVDAASLPLPTGAATAANQSTAIGHLATLAGAVTGTEVQVDVLTLPALPAGNNNIGDVDVASIAAGDNNIGNVDIVTVPADPFGANADAASATGSISAKLRQIAANGIPITSLPASTNTIEVVGDAAHDAAAAGNPLLMGAYASAAAPTAVSTDGDAVRLWSRLDGTLVVNDAPRASGGLTIHRKLSTGTSGDATNVKASAGQVYGAIITNVNAAARYVKLYNSASAPTAGAGTPVMTLAVPGNTAGAGMVFNFDKGIAFSAGIGYTMVTTAADSGSTGVAADEVILNLLYN